MTVISPSGRSRSIPLRLFCRAPRISTQPVSAGAVTQGFSAIFEPTEDYPIERTGSQMWGGVCAPIWSPRLPLSRRTATRLQKPLFDFLPLRPQPLRHVRLQRIEKLLLAFQLRFPFFRLHREQFAQLGIVDMIGADQPEILPLGNKTDGRFVCPGATFASI